MLKRTFWGQPIFWVQCQAIIQKVSKVVKHLRIFFKSTISFQHCQHLSFRGYTHLHFSHNHRLFIFVVVVVEKIILRVKMLIKISTLLQHFHTKFSFGLHHQFQHLVIGTPLKQKFPCKYLK